MRQSTSLAITLAAFAAQAEAFWGTAHMLIARRAQAILESDSPDVYSAALAELENLEASESYLTRRENNHPFTECATFADSIKGEGYSFQSDWHFINLPYLNEPGTTLDDFDFTMPDVDVVKAMTDMRAYLKGEIDGKDSTYIQAIAEKLPAEADTRSFTLRMLIHYVGDVHQPEHSTALVNSEFPNGDRGGNSEKIPSKDGVNNLHFVWDSAIYEYTGNPALPLSNNDWDWYTSEAEKLASKHEVDSDKLAAQDFQAWAEESFVMAQQYVYAGFVEGEDPDQDYIDKAQPVIEEHLMYGGARLAALVQDIYSASVIKPITFLE